MYGHIRYFIFYEFLFIYFKQTWNIYVNTFLCMYCMSIFGGMDESVISK